MTFRTRWRSRARTRRRAPSGVHSESLKRRGAAWVEHRCTRSAWTRRGCPYRSANANMSFSPTRPILQRPPRCLCRLAANANMGPPSGLPYRSGSSPRCEHVQAAHNLLALRQTLEDHENKAAAEVTIKGECGAALPAAQLVGTASKSADRCPYIPFLCNTENLIMVFLDDVTGSCYGAEENPGDCCNTCDQVREAYRKRGWALMNIDNVAQYEQTPSPHYES